MAFTKGVLDSADLCSGVLLGQDREQKSAGSYFLLEEWAGWEMLLTNTAKRIVRKLI